MSSTGIEKAISAAPASEHCKAGTASALAEHLGLSRGAISLWKKIPAERVRAVERITGVPRAELRPDLYGEEDAA